MSDIKLKQNDVIEAEIKDNGMAGEGIASYGGHTVFVPFSIAGERVRAKITHVRRDGVAFAELKEVLQASPMRVKPPCNRFGRCGGCGLMHMAYPLQLQVKRDNLNRLLKKNAGLNVLAEEPEPCSAPFGYRNKIQLPFGTVEGRTALGFYRENSHRIVPITKCFLHGDWAEKLIGIFLDYAAEFKLSAYDDATGKGHLKHLVARCIDGRLSAVLVTDGEPLTGGGYLVERLSRHFPSFSLYHSQKPERTNVILGRSLIPVRTEPFVIEASGVEAEIDPRSFLQVNSEIRDKIYNRIIGEITARSAPTVIDAYAGAGLLGAALAKKGARVYNIEIVPEATRDAEKLAARNGVADRVTNVNGDAAAELPLLIDRLSGNENLNIENLNIILDPPRKGIDGRVASALNAVTAPHRVYYISCNPATLTRDLARLDNYEVVYIKPYDMFCNTAHLETLVSLSKKMQSVIK